MAVQFRTKLAGEREPAPRPTPSPSPAPAPAPTVGQPPVTNGVGISNARPGGYASTALPTPGSMPPPAGGMGGSVGATGAQTFNRTPTPSYLGTTPSGVGPAAPTTPQPPQEGGAGTGQKTLPPNKDGTPQAPQAPQQPQGPSEWETFLDNYFNDLLGQDDKYWQQQQGWLQGNMSRLGREADITNARLGRGLGGGYAGLQGAALGEGMRAYNEAEAAHGDRRRNLQLGYMDRKIEEKRRQEERQWSQEDTTRDDEMRLIEMWLDYSADGGDLSWEEFMAQQGNPTLSGTGTTLPPASTGQQLAPPQMTGVAGPNRNDHRR